MLTLHHLNHERKYHEAVRNWRWRCPTKTTDQADPRIDQAEEKMNGWRSRFLLVAVMIAAMQVHAFVSVGLPNTDAGMLLFHGGAAAVDFALLYCAPAFVTGRICTDTQTLCLVSCVGNFVGWIAYMAYAPPIYYNTFMWGLSYVQFGLLLLVDHHGTDHLGFDLVRGGYRHRSENNFAKAHL